jgi:hypothetical protein
LYAKNGTPTWSSLRAADPATESVSVLPLCGSCHVGGPAPPLPFDDPGSLGGLLHLRGYRHGDLQQEIQFRLSPAAAAAHMPPNHNLTAEQRAALVRYLAGLAAP